MEDLLISTLEAALGYPVRLQGSLLPAEPYPDNFFTYWNNSSDGSSFYDDKENAILWQYSLNFYSNNPLLTTTQLLEAKRVLIAAGFEISGSGYSVASDEPTHTGRGIAVRYQQKR